VSAAAPPARAVGVFDSGVGGLTVLRALRDALPDEDYIYLGDTARLPYGTKSEHTVVRYALQAADELVARDVKCLVVACNTAAAAALPAMRERYADLPVIGVIEPGARAACELSRTGRILVLATESTVRGGAYARAILALDPQARVTALPCTLFVALAEEGWTAGAVPRAVAERYLGYLRAAPAASAPDTLLLGCTHFPVLAAVISAVAGEDMRCVDSALTTAGAVRALLQGANLLRQPAAAGTAARGARAAMQFLATDGAERFATVGERFLGEPIDAGAVDLIDL